MINLIWQTKDGDETQFEYQYITEYVFKDIQYNKYFDNKSYSTVLDNSVIIYSSNTNIIVLLNFMILFLLDKLNLTEKNFVIY
jgi:hypothetical protein